MNKVFSVDWFSDRTGRLTQWLSHLVNQPTKALEIGCFEGRSSVWFLQTILTHPESTLTCIDTFLGSVEHQKMNLGGLEDRFRQNVKEWEGKVSVMVGNSRAILPSLPPNSFDFAYVDGSHIANDVYLDAQEVWPLIKAGGIVVFDDYHWDGFIGTPNYTKLGVDLFLTKHNREYDFLSDYMLSVKKRTP